MEKLVGKESGVGVSPYDVAAQQDTGPTIHGDPATV